MGKTYFVSDVHMRPHFARRASFFTAFLHSIRGADRLYMLGDIFARRSQTLSSGRCARSTRAGRSSTSPGATGISSWAGS